MYAVVLGNIGFLNESVYKNRFRQLNFECRGLREEHLLLGNKKKLFSRTFCTKLFNSISIRSMLNNVWLIIFFKMCTLVQPNILFMYLMLFLPFHLLSLCMFMNINRFHLNYFYFSST
jgi:hypothetical protein